jgi:hypothetical protein
VLVRGWVSCVSQQKQSGMNKRKCFVIFCLLTHSALICFLFIMLSSWNQFHPCWSASRPGRSYPDIYWVRSGWVLGPVRRVSCPWSVALKSQKWWRLLTCNLHHCIGSLFKHKEVRLCADLWFGFVISINNTTLQRLGYGLYDLGSGVWSSLSGSGRLPAS